MIDFTSDVVAEIEYNGDDVTTFEMVVFKEAKQINSLIFDGNMTIEFWNNFFQDREPDKDRFHKIETK